MSTRQMKSALTDQLRVLMAPEIARQPKEIVIPEVVRLVFDHHDELGVVILPRSRDDHAHHMRKYEMTARLHTLYAQYTCRDVSIGDVVTDLLSIATEYKIEIFMPCEA